MRALVLSGDGRPKGQSSSVGAATKGLDRVKEDVS